MVSITLKVTGSNQVLRELEQIQKGIENLPVSEIGDMVVKEAQHQLVISNNYHAYPSKHPDNLMKGIVYIPEGRNRGKVVASAIAEKGFDYASVQENGGKAVNKPYRMRFIGRYVGKKSYERAIRKEAVIRGLQERGILRGKFVLGKPTAWVTTKHRKAIPAKHFMAKAREVVNKQVKTKVSDMIRKLIKRSIGLKGAEFVK